ncbi:hypothetical protein [Paracoccus litorisediminis]|uniref:Uncharacterized protein n=1 Tax=Paracoccus litorisediminis TaxID=2006130 RepID=A0A844HTP1_9RHOB|nr:hypothetical protein [Paracoccus litorisediminis]MTH61697.1 hypothetical protein [Paracoccus litorisediminis]
MQLTRTECRKTLLLRISLAGLSLVLALHVAGMPQPAGTEVVAGFRTSR